MDIEQIYKEKVASGKLSSDTAQIQVLKDLDVVKLHLENVSAQWQSFGLAYQWVEDPVADAERVRPKGLYFYGDVGRGKSMLMDLFFQNVQIQNKRRVHFHEFMAEVHNRMHAGGFEKGVDPVHKIAMDIAQDARLLCFDEFYISNIADAMMLGRLFEMLLKTGVFLCSTSNWVPENLFQGGHNRVLFKPFIKMIEKNMNIIALDGEQDWRRSGVTQLPYVYTSEQGREELYQLWLDVTKHSNIQNPQAIFVEDTVVEGTTVNDSLWVHFDDICGKPLASEQYVDLTNKYKNIFVESVPNFDEHMQNEAMRFVVMVDIFYEKGCALAFSAPDNPENLCPVGESAFAFERTASRIYEMQSRRFG